jgi:hypothetical protein
VLLQLLPVSSSRAVCAMKSLFSYFYLLPSSF